MKIAVIPTRTSVYWNSEEYVTNSISQNTPFYGVEQSGGLFDKLKSNGPKDRLTP